MLTTSHQLRLAHRPTPSSRSLAFVQRLRARYGLLANRLSPVARLFLEPQAAGVEVVVNGRWYLKQQVTQQTHVRREFRLYQPLSQTLIQPHPALVQAGPRSGTAGAAGPPGPSGGQHLQRLVWRGRQAGAPAAPPQPPPALQAGLRWQRQAAARPVPQVLPQRRTPESATPATQLVQQITRTTGAELAGFSPAQADMRQPAPPSSATLPVVSEHGLTPTQLTRVTHHVMHALDRRMRAHRERTGRM